jgi:two-component system, OmpR family, sensor histidine kinase KdpD
MQLRYHKKCWVEGFWGRQYDESVQNGDNEQPLSKVLFPYILVLTAISFVVWLYLGLIPGMNATTIALTYLLVVLIAASYGGLGSGIVASVAAVLCFNYFFLPPIGTLNIQDPQNWIALVAFLITAFVTSQLSSAARSQAAESERHRNEQYNLYQLSRAIILTPEPEVATTSIARNIVEIFRLDYCGIFIKRDATWERISVASDPEISDAFEPSLDQLQRALQIESIQESVAPDSRKRALYVPLKLGVKTIGIMAIVAPQHNRAVMEAVAGLVALALERARFLNELSRTRALQQSDELKSAILASVSHELRTPLTSIRAAIDSLMEDHVKDEKDALQEFHLIIREDVDRLTRLVENLLEMARIESTDLQLSRHWESIQELFQNVLNHCSDARKNHDIRIQIDEHFPLVKIDSRLLFQVLINLIDNASKYSPAGTEILLRAWLENENLFLSVTDYGPGISAEESPHIFEKFYRGRETQGASRGTGMGLAIARGIIQAHGGQIWFERRPGSGTTFICKIPVEQKAQILSV